MDGLTHKLTTNTTRWTALAALFTITSGKQRHAIKALSLRNDPSGHVWYCYEPGMMTDETHSLAEILPHLPVTYCGPAIYIVILVVVPMPSQRVLNYLL